MMLEEVAVVVDCDPAHTNIMILEALVEDRLMLLANLKLIELRILLDQLRQVTGALEAAAWDRDLEHTITMILEALVEDRLMLLIDHNLVQNRIPHGNLELGRELTVNKIIEADEGLPLLIYRRVTCVASGPFRPCPSTYSTD